MSESKTNGKDFLFGRNALPKNESTQKPNVEPEKEPSKLPKIDSKGLEGRIFEDDPQNPFSSVFWFTKDADGKTNFHLGHLK
jgi:hypothetical protein